MTQDSFFQDLYRKCLRAKSLEKGVSSIQAEIEKMGVEASVEVTEMLSFLKLDGYRIEFA